MTTTTNVQIDEERLWDALMKMARIGPGVAGGCNRQALTDEDGQARQLFQQWCQEAGLTVSVDEMGNMFARREGADNSLDPVYIGSHLDTQPTGGKYDGVLGVLGALEVVRTLNEKEIRTRRPIVVVNWTNEEGARFAPAMLSSGVFAGAHDRDWAYDQVDVNGKRFGDELERIGWKGDEKIGERRIHALYELHIEQGPILEAEDKTIGVVTHGQGLSWTRINVTGNAAHTGSTPMPMRRNAGLGMARILDRVDQIAWGHQPNAVGAVGAIDVFPNSRNVIPGAVEFTVDFRSADKKAIQSMEESLATEAKQICEELGLGLEMEKIGGFDPVAFNKDCVSIVREAAGAQGYAHRDIVSGAGHDACWIATVAPTAMIMCPCVDGLSHNEAEEITPAWAAAGTNVLCHAVLQTAEPGK